MNQPLRSNQTTNSTSKTSGELCTVLCKIPQGFKLQLYKTEEITEVIQGGTQKITRRVPIEDQAVRLNGPAHGQNEGPRFKQQGGYAITEGVPLDFWRDWMAQTGKDLKAVRENLIMMVPNISQAKDKVKAEGNTAITGLERLNPNKMPNLDKRFALKTADENKSEINLSEDEE